MSILEDLRSQITAEVHEQVNAEITKLQAQVSKLETDLAFIYEVLDQTTGSNSESKSESVVVPTAPTTEVTSVTNKVTRGIPLETKIHQLAQRGGLNPHSQRVYDQILVPFCRSHKGRVCTKSDIIDQFPSAESDRGKGQTLSDPLRWAIHNGLIQPMRPDGRPGDLMLRRIDRFKVL